MDRNWKLSAQRLLALILCAAMLLPAVAPQTVRADGEEGGVISSANITSVDTGVAGITSADSISDETAKQNAITTSTHQIQFDLVTSDTNLIQGGRYLIVQNSTDRIMSHDSRVENNDQANWPVQDNNGLNGGAKYAFSVPTEDAIFSEDESKLYLDQSYCHYTLWDLSQYEHDHDVHVNPAPGEKLSLANWANYGLGYRL